MAFFGATPQTGSSFNTSTQTGAGFFGSTSSTAGSIFTGGTSTTGSALTSTAPTTGSSFSGTAPEPSLGWFNQNFTFDFEHISDEFSWLGGFSLIGEGENAAVPGADGELRAFGLLESTGASVAQIESFLGLLPNTLNGLTGYAPTNGAVLKLTLTDLRSLEQLEEVQLDWNFTTGESAVNSYDDFAFYATSDGQVGVINRATDVGSQGSSGWQLGDLNLDTDDEDVFIAFGVLNVQDFSVNSFLGVDEVELVGVPADQGPAMGSAFFGF